MSIPIPFELEEQRPDLANKLRAAEASGSVSELRAALAKVPNNITVTKKFGTCRGHEDGDYERWTYDRLSSVLQAKCDEWKRKSSVKSATYTIRPSYLKKIYNESGNFGVGLIHFTTFGLGTIGGEAVTSREGYIDYYHYDWADDCPYISRTTTTISLVALRTALQTAINEQERKDQLEKERQEKEDADKIAAHFQQRAKAARENQNDDEHVAREETFHGQAQAQLGAPRHS